jgi:hypothetical protein
MKITRMRLAASRLCLLRLSLSLAFADRLNHRVLRFAPTPLPTVKASAGSVRLAKGRTKSVVFTLSSANHPGAYRVTYPRSNRSFSVASTTRSGSATPTMQPGSKRKITVRLKGLRPAKRPVPFALKAQSLAETARSASASISVSVR